MKRLGFDESTATSGANWNNRITNFGKDDAVADQKAIKTGFEHKVTTTKKSSKYDGEEYQSRRSRRSETPTVKP